MMLVCCSVPIVFNLQYTRSACGPTINSSMLGVLSDAVRAGPSCVPALFNVQAAVCPPHACWPIVPVRMQALLHYFGMSPGCAATARMQAHFLVHVRALGLLAASLCSVHAGP